MLLALSLACLASFRLWSWIALRYGRFYTSPRVYATRCGTAAVLVLRGADADIVVSVVGTKRFQVMVSFIE